MKNRMIMLYGELDRARLLCLKRDNFEKVFWTILIQERISIVMLVEH